MSGELARHAFWRTVSRVRAGLRRWPPASRWPRRGRSRPWRCRGRCRRRTPRAARVEQREALVVGVERCGGIRFVAHGPVAAPQELVREHRSEQAAPRRHELPHHLAALGVGPTGSGHDENLPFERLPCPRHAEGEDGEHCRDDPHPSSAASFADRLARGVRRPPRRRHRAGAGPHASDPWALIQLVEESGLRGRGGAGFPTGRKWRTVRENLSASLPSTVVVNGAEGEPGRSRIARSCAATRTTCSKGRSSRRTP